MPSECRFDPVCRCQSGTRIATSLAEEQDGVVGRAQLLEAGVGPGWIDRQVATGWLVVLWPGVYAVGHRRLLPRARRIGVLLACGADAALSHRSSGDGLGLIADRRAIWDVTVPRGCKRGAKLPGIRVHRSTLRPDQVTEIDGVRMTGVARTLVDLAAIEPERHVSRAVDAALREQLYDQRSIDGEIRSGRRGAARLRHVLEARHPDAHLTRSELEARALELLAVRGLPRPEVNVWLGDLFLEVDLLWRSSGLVVELDGRRYHAHRRAADAERDRRLEAVGLEVCRYGWGDVTSGWMADELAGRPNLRPSPCRPGLRQPIHTA